MHKLAATVLLAFLFATAALADGKHVIVLIDDSRDMKGWRDELEQKLPRWLFRGVDPSDPSSPRFDPATDTMSLLYFSLRSDGVPDGCKAVRGDVISPDTLLQFEPVDAGDEERFRGSLHESLSKPCRFDGHLSPIVTAPTLALPYIQGRLPADALFSRVLIATATNDELNFKGSTASAEMSHLVKDFPEFHVQAPQKTLDRADSVTTAFNFDAPNHWRDERGGLRYRVIEAVPRGRTPEAAMIFNRRIQLDRVAAGSDRVYSVPRVPGTGDIRIPRSELVPLAMTWRLAGRDALHSVDLTRCAAPVCTADGDGIRIDLFHPAVNPTAQGAADAPPPPRALQFRVAFRVDTKGIYDHLKAESAEQQMELTPVRPASAWLLAYPLRFDNALLTRLWFRGDGVPPAGGLTHDEAQSRVERLNFAAWFVTIVLLLLVIARVARRSRVYAFEPHVEWTPAAEVTLDFDRPGHSRILLGSLVVRNHGKVGWLGRRLGGVEQPTREAAVSLDPKLAKRISDAGFQSNGNTAIGFFDEHRRLVGNVRDAVSDGRQIHVFLAEEAFEDFHAKGAIAEQVVPLRIPVKLEFAAADVASPKFAAIAGEIAVELRVKPEQPRIPEVAFERAANGELHYGHDARLAVGRFVFRSRAAHRFALPFHDAYAVAATCEKRPLAGKPLRLLPDTVSLPAHGSAAAAVELWCGDSEVRNPEPVTHRYTFALHGPHEAAYPTRDLAFDLRRDPARAELELHLTYRSQQVEVHWNAARAAWECRAEPGVEFEVDAGAVRFAKASRLSFEGPDATQTPLSLDVGNSAKSGRGSVSVIVSGGVVLSGDSAGMLHMRQGWQASDILELPPQPIKVREGEAPVSADVFLRSTPISSIDGGEILPEGCTARIALAIEVIGDSGKSEKRTLNVEFPLHLEQLPGADVTVIDFGTSSIAAAVGTAGERNDNPLLDLQHLKVYQNESVATVDPRNPEIGTPFIPSSIVCDADERQTVTDYGRNVPPGFPRHTGTRGALLVPSAASFVTLPARTDDLAHRSGRVLLSLKTWLGMNAQYVPLPAGEIRYRDGANERVESWLPLDDVLEASYAALAQAYLKPLGRMRSGQVVICHPNTFSELHRERLHGIAWKALARPLEIVSPKHLHLMSESDAVAYAYCADRMRETRPAGTERVLVYDLGAGTLDLSVITIEWNADPIYPIFRTRHHLGVPIAGNYFDESLARIVHELLSDKDVLGTEKLRYGNPLVAVEKNSDGHAAAARASWNDVRLAKQQWSEDQDFEVVVGDTLAAGLVDIDHHRTGPDVPKEIHGRAGVVVRATAKGEQLVLVVPYHQIVTHPRIVRLVEFVAREVIQEALAAANLRPEQIDTLIVSGRGALWPGLKKRIHEEVPAPHLAPLITSEAMKAAVARGAIAQHDLIRQTSHEGTAPLGRRLAVVYGHGAGTNAVFEDRWDRPITIPVARFRVVDVGLSQPDPARDLGNGSLRKHFYVGVGRHEYPTRHFGGNVLRFRKVSGGEVVITNEEGMPYRIGRDTLHHAYAAWPVGQPFLSPEEQA